MVKISEELKINIKTDTDSSEAKKKLDSLIKEYNDKKLEFKVSLGQFDISGISSSIARLTGDLNKLTNIEFGGLNKLETNLKNINKLMREQSDISSNKNNATIANASENIKRLVGDQKESANYIEELEMYGKDIKSALDSYTKNNEAAIKDFNDKNKDVFDNINFYKNSSSSTAFKKILQYQEEMEAVQKKLADTGVKWKGYATKTFEDSRGEIKTRTYNQGYEDLIGQTEERFEKSVEEAKAASKRIGQLRKNIENNVKNISQEEELALKAIEVLKRDLKPSNIGNDSTLGFMGDMFNEILPPDLLKGLDFKFNDDIFEGYDRFLKYVKDLKKEFNQTFKDSDGFAEFKLFDDVQKVVNNLDNSIESVNLDNLKDKLTNAFDIDEKVISNIEKIENALKQLNSMSELTQKSLFETNGKSGMELELDSKIKEYLAIDKSINDAYTKMSKAQLNGNNDVVSALEKEINLLRQKQALQGMEIRGMGADDGLLEQIRLQEQLNRAIAETSQVEYKNSFMDKMHNEALKLNQEFDEVHKKQQQMNDFSLPAISETSDLKSYVEYLDSAEDGLKRIITQYTKMKGVDMTTTLYGDGTEVRKITGNMEKATNELATAYKQADNELTRLIRTQQQMDFKGDTETVALLDKQIANWKQIKASVEDTAREVKVYDQMVEKSQSTLMKNKQLLDTNQSKIDFTIDVNNQNALRKVEEFKSKTLSNLQELERKYQGTQLYDDVIREIERFKSELKSLDSYLENVENVDMSHLSGEFRRISQDVTQVKRDMNALNKSITNNFFDDLYDSMRTFTLGNIIGDAIQNAAYQIKDAVVGLDSVMRDMMKVAPESFAGTSDQLQQVKNDALEVAKSVGQSTEDVIQGMSKALQTGASTMQDALEIAKASATFATVGDLDQGQADTYIASVMSAFYGMENALKPVRTQVQGMGEDYDNLTNFLDLANYAGNNFAISTGDVGEALQRSGSILSNYGVTLDESVAMVVGANESIQDSSKVGTSLKTMALRIGGLKTSASEGTLELNKTAKSLQEIAKIDIYSDKQTGQVKDMYEILNELNGIWDTLREDEQMALSEALAGAEHANTLQALMGNWDAVLQYQSDYNNGFTVGSAQREQEKYLDSIEGKWNVLRENLKALVTTTISSDFTKGLLDGAIALTDGLNNVIQFLDDINMALPTTVALITAMGQSFKALSGNGSVNNWSKSFLNNIKQSKTDALLLSNAMGRLSQNQTKLSTNTVKSSQSFKTYSTGVNSAGQSIIRLNRENMTLAKQQPKTQKGLTGLVSGFKNTATASKLAMVGTSLLNGALIGLGSLAIAGVIKGLDHLANGLENAEEEIRATMDTIQGAINEDSQDLAYLNETEDRYNELIKKKQEYSNIPMESMTEEQLAEMQELEGITSRLAEMFPELVIGYDSNGSPIMLMADDMEKLKERTQEQIDLNKELLKIERQKLADNAREQVQEGDFFDGSLDYQLKKNDMNIRDSYNRKMTLENEYINAVMEGNDMVAGIKSKSLAKEEKELQDHYNQGIQLYQEYKSKELEIQQSAFDQIQAMKGFENLEGDNLSNVQGFIDNLNWANLDEGQYSKWINSFDEVIGLANSGSPKLQEWNDTLELANGKYEATGNIEEYNNTLSNLAKTMSEELNLDYETVFSGLENMVKPLSESEKKLNSFLETFGKTRYDLLNGDDIAVQLAEQFQAVDDVVSTMLLNKDYAFKANGSLTFDMMTDIANKEEIPKQIQDLANSLAEGGVTKAESDLMIEILMAINSGDQAKVENAIENVNSKLKEMGMEEHVIDIKTLFDASGVDEANQKTNELDGKTTESTHNVKTEGKEDLEDTKKSQDEQNGKVTESTHKVNSEGADETKQDLEEVKQKADEVDSKDVNLSVNNGELQGSVESFNQLIEYSTKLENGEYSISFKSDTADAIAQIDNLKLAINNLSEQFRTIPATTVTIHTALAAQNLSGLINRINETKGAISGLQGKTINIITALAAQNLSGLIVRVNQYKTAISSIKDKNMVVNTSQAAKNISGLIAKIKQYNGTNPKTLTFRSNASAVAGQVNSLARAVRSVPNGKTITYNIRQNGSVPKVSSSRMALDSSGVQSQILGVQQQLRSGISANPVDISFANTSPTVSPIIRRVKPSEVMPGFDYDINLLERLENKLKDINNQLDALSEKSDKAFGQEKIGYLQQQIGLYEKQKQTQLELIEALRVQQNEYKYYLATQGMMFDNDGNAINAKEKLLALEKNLVNLKAQADKEGASDKTKANYEAHREELERLKDVLSEYNDITFSELPDAQLEWDKLTGSINDAKEEIDSIKLSMQSLDLKINVGNSEASLNAVRREITRLEEDIDRAYGAKKQELIKKKIELLKKEQEELHKLANNYRAQAQVQKDYLAGNGFVFNADGTIANLEHLKSLMDDINYDTIKESLEEYIELTQNKIPDLSEDWWDLEDAIGDCKDEIEEAKKELQEFLDQAKVEAITDRFEDLNHEIAILDKLMEHATWDEKLDLMAKKMELLKEQQKELQKQYEFFNSKKSTLQSELSGLGFTFDKEGNITNYVEQLEKLANSSENFEEIKKKLEEYFDIQDGKLPEIEEGWLDLENAIKDALKEQLEITKEVQDKIMDIYRKQVEERKKLIDEELDKRLKALKKEQDAYNDARDEQDYKKDYDKQLQKVMDIQKQLELASKDTSLAGQKKYQELLEQLKDEQEKLEDLVQDKIDKDVNDMFDDESDRLEQEAEDSIKDLEDKFTPEYIANLVSEALGSGLFTNIDGSIVSLKDAMIDFAKESGELFGVLGSTIQDELLGNLNIALDTFKDLSNILKELDIKDISKSIGRMSMPNMNTFSGEGMRSVANTINFNQPLCVIEGNVTEDVMPELDRKFKELKNDIFDTITKGIRN